MIETDVDFGDVLAALNVEFRETPYWLNAGSPPVRQGWKLHLSAIPIRAVELVEAVAPYLRDEGVCFKVARRLSVLELLNAGQLGPTQIGKFITVYPALDRARSIAEKLRDLSGRFEGPSVSTDLQLGAVLFARYGSFVPQIWRDRLGIRHGRFQAPDGAMQIDAYHVPFKTPEGVINVFDGLEFRDDAESDLRSRPGMLGPGYRVIDVLRDDAKGAKFLAINLKSQTDVEAVVLKQGRRHRMSDRFGRDALTRLRRESAICGALASIEGIVAPTQYFEAGGHGYLALPYRKGRTIEDLVAATLQRRPWADTDPAGRLRLLGCMLRLLDIVGGVHEKGYVHRDLNNTNFWMCDDGGVVLLDFEMAHRVGDGEPVVGLGTTGFASPQQMAGTAPTYADDIYSLGCILVLMLTGIDPRRVLFAQDDKRIDQINVLTGGARELDALTTILAGALAHEPEKRPSIENLKRAVFNAHQILAGASAQGHQPRTSERSRVAGLKPLLSRVLDGLLYDTQQTQEGLWLSLPLAAGDQGTAIADLELLRSAHSGIAGVLYILSTFSRAGFGTRDDVVARAKHASAWLIEGSSTSDSGLPGLHFGEAGVALALHEAIGAGFVEDEKHVRKAISDRLPGCLDWPDLTHGAAGQGLAALAIDPQHASACADYLVQTQEADGSWATPEGASAGGGHKLTGFAHGAAGMVYFLAEFVRRQSNRSAEAALMRGIAWLNNNAVSAGGSKIEWPYSNRVQQSWNWWCHGGPGIALAYLRCYEVTGDKTILQTALGALEAHPQSLRYGNLSYCHGLSGLGEIYLEAYRVSQDRIWLERARALLAPIFVLARQTDRGVTWAVEDPKLAIADLGLGCCGVAHFLLRLLEGPDRIGLPLLPRPIS